MVRLYPDEACCFCGVSKLYQGGFFMTKRFLALLLTVMMLCSGLTLASASEAPKVTYWLDINSNVSANFQNLGDTPFGKGLIEATGIDIEFQHPPIGQAVEQFNYIVSDEVKPDIIEYNWLNAYPGGPEKAISDGVIIPLNEVFEKYCPNITKYLAENPDVDKMIRTDSGTYYCFPFIRGDRELQTSVGPIVRADWLRDFGMETLETIDDWYTYLTRAKDEKGATSPYTHIDWLLNELPFAYTYGLRLEFYLDDDGKVQYGPYTPQYKDFLTLMNKWYTEKLIDQDIATMKQGDILTAKITNGEAAAIHGYAGSGIGTYMNAVAETNPDYDLKGVKYPVLNAGDQPEMGHLENKYVGGSSAAISTSCKDIETAARLLDFAYGDEGRMYYNFGVEGVSYTLVDGEPVYTDLILKNPDGWSVGYAMAAHIRGSYNGPEIQDVRYIWQFLQLPQQVEAYKNWAMTNADKHAIPPVSATPDESSELAAIMTEVDTYFKEMYFNFMNGTESLDNFDKYMETMNAMGIERAIEIKQAALERYNAR